MPISRSRETKEKVEPEERQMIQEVCEAMTMVNKGIPEKEETIMPKRSLKFFWEGRSRKRQEKEDYREKLRQRLSGMEQLAVCEETVYESTYGGAYEEARGDEEFGKTIYIEENHIKEEPALYKPDGELAEKLAELPFVIGKKKENVNLAINDYSVSRVHARITREEGFYYIEDLNSTNGTYLNGKELFFRQPVKLETMDRIVFGTEEYVFS